MAKLQISPGNALSLSELCPAASTHKLSVQVLLRGWMNYFRLAEVKGIFEELDSWIRRKPWSYLAPMEATLYSRETLNAVLFQLAL